MTEDAALLVLESFSPHVGSPFVVDLGDGRTLDLTLVEVRDLGTTPRPPGGPTVKARPRAFAAYFRGPAKSLLPQRTYAFRHEVLGNLSLFIVPIGPDGVGMKYEAIFN